MSRPLTRICVGCGCRLKNRSKGTIRCWECHKEKRAITAMGRVTGRCLNCGRCLALKKNATGRCRECCKSLPRPLRGPTGMPAWNSGQTMFEGLDHKKEHTNTLRRQRRQLIPADSLLADRIRTLIRNSLKRRGCRKDTKTSELLGCSPLEFREHIEKLFESGMGWHNYGNGGDRWNIDHIVPIAAFDLKIKEEQLRAFHYTNCRPMWAIDNIKKGGHGRKLSALAITATVTFGYER